MEGTLFHPARRECLSNAQVWQDGFCPLLSASEEDQTENEGDDEGSGSGDQHLPAEKNGVSEPYLADYKTNLLDQKADIKVQTEEMESDSRETPTTAELEDPVRINDGCCDFSPKEGCAYKSISRVLQFF